MNGLARTARRLAGSLNLRRVADNLAWLLAEKALRLACALVVGAWVARYLGPEQFGLLSYALALVSLVMFLPSLGLEDVVRREIMRSPDREETMRVLGTAWRLRVATGVVTAAGFVLAILGGDWAGEAKRPLLLVATLLSPGQVVATLLLFQPALWLPELYFQARDQARRSARAQLIALVAGSAGRVVLVAAGARLVWFAAAGVAEVLLVGGLCWGLMRGENLPGWWRRWDGGLAWRLLKAGWPLLMAGAAVSVYMKIDQVMLQEMSGEAEAGIYAAATRLSEAVYFLPIAVVTALLPLWTRVREKGGVEAGRFTQGMYDLLAALAYGFAVPVSCLSGWLVDRFFGVEFAPAGPVLAIHAWAAVFVFLGVTRSQDWVLADLNRWTFLTTLAGAVANVVLNWWSGRSSGSGRKGRRWPRWFPTAWPSGSFLSAFPPPVPRPCG